jgi:hypothetical protein
MITMRLTVALSTKLDYDELRNVTRVARDGTYGTVSSGTMFRICPSLVSHYTVALAQSLARLHNNALRTAAMHTRACAAIWRGQQVAVKLLRVQSLPDAKVVAAFEKEMLLLSKLRVSCVFGCVCRVMTSQVLL